MTNQIMTFRRKRLSNYLFENVLFLKQIKKFHYLDQRFPTWALPPTGGRWRVRGGGGQSKLIWVALRLITAPDKNQYLSELATKYFQNISQYHNFL